MLNEKARRYLAGLLIGTMAFSMAACNKKEGSTETGNEVKLAAGGVYPIECEDTLTWWGELNLNLSTEVSNLGETNMAKELEKRTGVKVEYLHPAQGQQAEQFNLLIASNDLPDLISYNWQGFGAQMAVDSGYITNLNEPIQKWAPNLSKVLSENAHYDKMVKTDEGTYYVFPTLTDGGAASIYSGPIVRKDWLDKLGMEVPTTIDEFETMLRRFKNELGVDFPLSTVYGMLAQTFAPAYGAGHGWFVGNDGKVHFGPVSPGYKEYLTKMNSWYKEGLLDNNVANTDLKTVETNLLNDRVGATLFNAGAGIGKWMNAKATKDPTFELVGTPVPTMNKGEVQVRFNREWEYIPSVSTAISATCKNLELATRFLDYGYGEEGRMFYVFGTEGVSYNMVDGEPMLTDMIINSEKGISQALTHYCRGSYSGPFVGDSRLTMQMQSKPVQAFEAIQTWNNNVDVVTHSLPPISFTEEEQKELAKLTSEFGTYSAEMILKFIVGIEPLEKYDEYLAQMEKFNIARALEIYDQALSRYTER